MSAQKYFPNVDKDGHPVLMPCFVHECAGPNHVYLAADYLAIENELKRLRGESVKDQTAAKHQIADPYRMGYGCWYR